MTDNLLKEQFLNLRDTIIELHFEHLNNDQRRAVLSHDKNKLILACPGSGKTTVLLNRLLYLTTFGEVYRNSCCPDNIMIKDIQILKGMINNYLAQGNWIINERLSYLLRSFSVNPKNIITITFTRAAAMNMKERFKKMAGETEMPFFGTFHSLFYKILMRNTGNITLIESKDAYRLINSILTEYMDEVSDDKIKEVINCISLYKNSRGMLKDQSFCIDKSIFEKCYNSYEEYKLEKGVKDFDDLQLECRELFCSNSLILEYYRKGFKYMLVDEFQDCDSLQIELLKLLNINNSIFAVGDEDQCIYGFRGSRPDYMVEFDKNFSGGKKQVLSINYRCPKAIVENSKKLIENNKLRNKKDMLSNKQTESPITVENYFDESSCANGISSMIEKLRAIGGYNFSDNAVLYRTNMESRNFIDAFIRRKIPFKLLDKEYNFFEHFICKDILSYLKLSIDASDMESFIRVINRPFRYVSKINISKVKNHILKDDCFDILKNIEDLPIYQMKSIEKLQREVLSLNKMSLCTAIEFIISDLGYHDYIKEHSVKFKIEISELEEILEEFKQSAAEFNTIITFLVHVDQVKEELKKNSGKKEEDSVILSTIHGVKGMEFKNVFIVNCNEENIPHINSMTQNIEEERRLFYVAMTRAIDNLYIYIPERIRGKAKVPSRFIAEANLIENHKYNFDFEIGEKVIHETFGEGRIIALNNNEIDIQFDNIMRKFDIVILQSKRIIRKIS